MMNSPNKVQMQLLPIHINTLSKVYKMNRRK